MYTWCPRKTDNFVRYSDIFYDSLACLRYFVIGNCLFYFQMYQRNKNNKAVCIGPIIDDRLKEKILKP